MVLHVHSSSLYSESPSSLNKQVQTYVDSTDPSLSLITYTEVGSSDRTKVLKEADKDWAAWVPDKTDVGIMWTKADFDPIWKHCVKLTDKVWTDGQGRKHTTYCGSALLKKVTGNNAGKKVLVSVCHLPSHVQNGKNFYDNAQSKAWKSACAGWNDHWNEVRKEDKPDLGLIIADWNVDFHSATWRDRVQSYFPSMFLCWVGNMPPDGKGTHGSRLIDGTMATSKASDAKLLKDDNSSDHRPYGEKVPF